MKCNEVKIQLNDYIDGLLPEDTGKAIGEHLAECPECRKEYDELTSIIEEAKLIPKEVDPPKDLWKFISRKIGIEEKNAKIFQLEKSSSKNKNYSLKFELSRLFPGRKIAIAGSVATFIVAVLLYYIHAQHKFQIGRNLFPHKLYSNYEVIIT